MNVLVGLIGGCDLFISECQLAQKYLEQSTLGFLASLAERRSGGGVTSAGVGVAVIGGEGGVTGVTSVTGDASGAAQ